MPSSHARATDGEDPTAPALHRTAVVSAAAAAAIPILVLISWGVELKSAGGGFFDDWPRTNPSAAILLLGCALGALGIALGSRAAGIASGSAVLVLAALSALRYPLGWFESSDGSLVGQFSSYATARWAPPMPQTLVVVSLVALACILTARHRHAAFRSALLLGSTVISVLSLFSLLAASFGLRIFEGNGSLPLPAVVATLLLATSLVVATPEHPPASVILQGRRTDVILVVATLVLGPLLAMALTAGLGAMPTQGVITATLQTIVVLLVAGALATILWFSATRDEWAKLAAASVDGVILVKADGEIMRMSSGAEKLVGWRADELVGQQVEILVPPEHRALHAANRAMFNSSPQRRSMGPLEVALLHKDGTLLPVEIDLVPMHHADGVVVATSIRDVSDRIAKEREMRHYRARLSLLTDSSSLGFITLNRQGRIVEANDSFSELVGFSREELLRGGIAVMTHEDDLPSLSAATVALRCGEQRNVIRRVRFVRKDSREVWVDFHLVAMHGRDGAVDHIIGQTQEVTDQVHAEQALEQAQQRLRMAIEQAPIGQLLTDMEGRVLDSNASLRSMVKMDADGLSSSTYQQLSEPGDLRRETSMDESLRSGAIPGYVIDKRLMRHDGSTVWTRCHRSLVRDSEGRPISILTQAQDIRAERDAMEARDNIESELRRRTSYDQLTGIRNREAITEFLDHALGTGRRAGQGTAVLFIDLDNFKQINDGISHHAGDQVLAGVARLLEETLRSTDAVGRLGGDEFLAVLTELHTDDEADLAAGRIRERIAGCRLRVDNDVVGVTASIGLARAQETSTVDRLLREADIALHRAKHAGRNRIEVFDDSLRQDVEHRVRLHADLRDALDDDRIEAWFQPIVHLASETLTGYEALARWRRPDGAVVPAGKFIPIAEESRLIHPLGASVIGESLAQLELIPEPLTMSINASPSQLSSQEFTNTFERLLVCCGVEPSRVIVEITETQLLNLPEAAHVGMCRLADAGVRWQIDDFGTGYSSLSVLRDYPITGIKLDRSFTADLGRNPVPATMQIVGGIADLATRLGAMLIAEGIETPAQAATLRELGWTHGQGWLFGRPSPPQRRSRPRDGSQAAHAGGTRVLPGRAGGRPPEPSTRHRP